MGQSRIVHLKTFSQYFTTGTMMETHTPTLSDYLVSWHSYIQRSTNYDVLHGLLDIFFRHLQFLNHVIFY